MAIDLTDRDAVRMIIEGMRPDIVVHAALRWPAEMAFEKLTEADIDMALEVNLSATLHLTRVVLPVMKQRRQGAFFVISPGSGEGGPLIERTVTGASQTFARALQDEVAGEGVVVEHFFAGEPPFTSVVASIHNKLKTDRLMPVGHTQNHRGTHNAT
ncbi:NAD(P)-dependent dehydrogenase (short-subunit alcohol dehydrogenase family) [Rhizobium wenxiniae]|uniref:NAD(P)-dependent dehydrogenase (Short-subunit alcohol dehydrogenase family) n=2 Tax=Rhizobium wenxiniae TaxID=1737357 RepID=A0A7W9YB26_9HYPH|nr:NAD(P)-dependent dehydrogenase (short-subunit alcohol dehydrogenase family) [Rhizobium wenxiniae]